MLYVLYAFLAAMSFTDGANVLVFWPLPIPSHFRGFEPLFTELARRGHNVTVVSHFPKSSPVANYTDVAILDGQTLDESLTTPGTYWTFFFRKNFPRFPIFFTTRTTVFLLGRRVRGFNTSAAVSVKTDLYRIDYNTVRLIVNRTNTCLDSSRFVRFTWKRLFHSLGIQLLHPFKSDFLFFRI